MYSFLPFSQGYQASYTILSYHMLYQAAYSAEKWQRKYHVSFLVADTLSWMLYAFTFK